MTKKTLSKILEGYLDDYMTPDSQKFIQSHTVAKLKGDKATGTSDDDLFAGKNIKPTKLGGPKKEHGYKNPEDEKAYDPHVTDTKPVKEEKHHKKDCECEKCENDRDEMKEETHSPEDLHFKKQSKKMQDAINLHLRNGKNYTDAVKAAKMHVKEDVDQIGEGVGVRNQIRKAILVGAKSANTDKEHEINKNIITKLTGKKEAGKTYDTAKKMVAKEEVEELDELSDRIKSAYMGSSVGDLVARSQGHGYNVAKNKKNLGDNARKIRNRQDGIYRATKGMRREEVEELPEDHFENLRRRKQESRDISVHEEAEIAEKTLMPAEIKKRNEIADAIKRRNPNMPDDQKMKFATAAAKRVTKQKEIQEAGMPSSVIKHKQQLANMTDEKFAEKHGDKTEKQLRSLAWSHGYGKPGTPGHDHYVNRVAAGLKEEFELEEAALNLSVSQKGHLVKALKSHIENAEGPEDPSPETFNHLDKAVDGGGDSGSHKEYDALHPSVKKHLESAFRSHKNTDHDDPEDGELRTVKHLDKAADKHSKQLQEAKRGRPSKSNPEQNIEPIQTQLQKMHKQSEVDVTFADKSQHTIPRKHANKALKHLSSLKPIHREAAQKQMSSSKQGFYDTLAGKKPEAQPKITLAKLRTMKESSQTIVKLGTMGVNKKAVAPSDEAREKKPGGGDD